MGYTELVYCGCTALHCEYISPFTYPANASNPLQL